MDEKMFANVIVLDADNKKRVICQFVIASKEDANAAIKTIREMCKVEEQETEKKEKHAE
jgi:hypothetical protein